MEPKCSCGGSSTELEFGFAFNDNNFSDRVLRIEIMTDPVDAPPSSDSVSAMADNQVRHSKRRRISVSDLTALPDEQILKGNQPEMDDGLPVPYENQDGETVEEFPLGDEAANKNDSNWSRDCSAATIVSVKTLHVSSPILAAKSPFFYKLLSNGMRESEQKHVTIKINASEEASVMELLSFMYSNTLNVTAVPALLDVLIAADKFEVSSCMKYCCSKLLQNSPMTTDSALLYLDLPRTVAMADAVQPLIDAAKHHLAGQYKDLTEFEEEVMDFPLSVIEAILASDDLHVESEDDVYDFVLKWATKHYNRLEERQEVLGSRLGRLIRFPYMTGPKLEKALVSNDLGYTGTSLSNVILAALVFKTRPLHLQRSMAAAWDCGRFVERAYKLRPVKVVEFELPRQGCVVYLDLKREECANLFPPGGRVFSQTFHVGGEEFNLSARCYLHERRSSHFFALVLGMLKKSSSASFTVDFEFAARSRPTEDFVSKFKSIHTFTTGRMRVGPLKLFQDPWTSFMAEDSPFFINGVLHLRAEVAIRH